MILTIALVAAFALVYLGPDIPIRRTVVHLLIEGPAGVLGAGPLALAARLFAVVAVAGLVVGAPELVLILGVADLAVVMEIAALAWLVLGATRIRVAARIVLAMARAAVRILDPRPVLRRAGRRSPARRIRRGRPARGDDDGLGYAFA